MSRLVLRNVIIAMFFTLLMLYTPDARSGILTYLESEKAAKNAEESNKKLDYIIERINELSRKVDLLLKGNKINVVEQTSKDMVTIYDNGDLRIRGPEEVKKAMEEIEERYNKEIDSDLERLITAIRNQNRLKITSLLNEKPYVANMLDPFGKTPLMHAVWYKNSTGTEILQLLIDYGADVNLTDEHNNTALSSTQFTDNIDGAKLLLSNGANPHIKNDHTGTSVLDDLRKDVARYPVYKKHWKEVIEVMEKVKK